MAKDKKQNYFADKIKNEPVDFVITCLLALIVIAYFFCLIFGKFIFGETSHFWLSLNFFSDYVGYNVFLRILSYAIFILTASKVIRILIGFFTKTIHHRKSILNLLSGFIKYFAIIVLIFISLNCLGVNTTTLLASAGILSLIIGLGAQPLIEDIIAGLFIAFEGIFEDGDIVVIDGFRGQVREIGIRATKIMDTGGNIKVINNSDIRMLVNMTDELSLAVSEVEIEYGESLARVENVIERSIPFIKEAIPSIIEGPIYKGVQAFGASGVRLKFVAKCKEDNRFQCERDLNRQIKLMFDENDITVPFTQIVLWDAEKEEKKKKGNLQQAENFVETMRAEGKGMGDDSNGIK